MSKLNKFELTEWKKYRIPGTIFNKVKVDAIHLSIANSDEHELAKCSLALKLMRNKEKILTEADEIVTGLRRDLISLSSGEIFEIEDFSKKRGHRHPRNINVFWYDLNRLRTFEEANEDDKKCSIQL